MYIYIPCRFYSQNLKFEKTGNSRSGSSSSRKETNKESERDTQTRIRRTTVIRVG